jgi:hypothetical protein
MPLACGKSCPFRKEVISPHGAEATIPCKGPILCEIDLRAGKNFIVAQNIMKAVSEFTSRKHQIGFITQLLSALGSPITCLIYCKLIDIL